ncbi:MAG: 4Fe-4S dicluster domain-containing protein [Anaerolineae bacterium]
MNARMLPKDQLHGLIAGLMQTHRLVAPRWVDEELRFAEIEAPEQVVLDYRNTRKAPKAVLLQQTERLALFAPKLDDYNPLTAVPLDTRPTVLLGARPCDARSFLLLDRVFLQQSYVDPYYQARRENLLVFSLACDHPRATCFCHAFGSGPYDADGSDVLLREAGDAYLLVGASTHGAALLDSWQLAPADAAHIEAAEGIRAAAEAHLAEVEPVTGIDAMLAGLFDSGMWAEISEKCIACGTCTYNCPTCHCFTIEDRTLVRGSERVRGWDSCMYAIFTQHASGHNPRVDQAARWRQRTMHKFNYLPRNVALFGCVGCGRCVQQCPVQLDIRQVLARVRQEHAAAGAKAQE